MDNKLLLKQITEKYNQGDKCIEVSFGGTNLPEKTTIISQGRIIFDISSILLTQLALKFYKDPNLFQKLGRLINELSEVLEDNKSITDQIDELNMMLFNVEKTANELDNTYKTQIQNLNIPGPILIDGTKYYRFSDETLETLNI